MISIAFRAIRRRPKLFAAEICLLGVGFATALLSISTAHATLDMSLRCPRPDRTFFVATSDGFAGGVPEQRLNNWKGLGLFSSIGGFFETPAYVTGVPAPSYVTQAYITEGMLDFLPPKAASGRSLRSSDFPYPESAIIVTEHFLRMTGLTTSSCIGRVIGGLAAPYVIVGVLPSTARFPSRSQPDILVPYEPSYLYQQSLTVLIEIRQGILPSSAARTLNDQSLSGSTQVRSTVALVPIGAALDKGQAQIAGYGLAVGLATLCLFLSTAAFIELVDTTRRKKEFSVKLALGARRSQLFVEKTKEIFLICTVSLTLGIFILEGSWSWVSRAWNTEWVSLPEVDAFSMGCAAALLILSCGIAATGPIMILRARNPLEALKEEGSTVGRPMQRTRMAIVTLQLAICVSFAVSSTKLSIELREIATRPLGISVANIWSGTILVNEQQSLRSGRSAFLAEFEQLRTKLSSIPGVASAAFASELPAAVRHSLLAVVHTPLAPSTTYPLTFVDSDYLRLLGSDLVQGRYFQYGDFILSTPPVILSKPLATELFGEANPVGNKIAFGRQGLDVHEVVGVVSGMRTLGLRKPTAKELFMPMTVLDSRLALVVRATRGPISFRAVREAASGALPGAALEDFKPLKDRFDDELDVPRRRLTVLTFFSLITALVAVSGLCSALLSMISDRDVEIGIRLALGASNGDIARALLRSLAPWVILGAILGTAAPALFSDPLSFDGGVSSHALALAESETLAFITLAVAVSLWVPLKKALRRPINDLLRTS